MFRCEVCGGRASRAKMVSEVFEVDGKRVLVENIPAQICAQCGEMTFSRETTERVRRMVHGEAEPSGVVELDVFAYA
ncbi:MAG: YgiT-type zinc finger protein [Anaerolineales bacterium]|nr:YgiT-type zinc finger protein [Anaerolineales bacterium]